MAMVEEVLVNVEFMVEYAAHNGHTELVCALLGAVTADQRKRFSSHTKHKIDCCFLKDTVSNERWTMTPVDVVTTMRRVQEVHVRELRERSATSSVDVDKRRKQFDVLLHELLCQLIILPLRQDPPNRAAAAETFTTLKDFFVLGVPEFISGLQPGNSSVSSKFSNASRNFLKKHSISKLKFIAKRYFHDVESLWAPPRLNTHRDTNDDNAERSHAQSSPRAEGHHRVCDLADDVSAPSVCAERRNVRQQFPPIHDHCNGVFRRLLTVDDDTFDSMTSFKAPAVREFLHQFFPDLLEE